MLAFGCHSITSGWNLLSWLTMPRNLLNSVWSWGVFIFKMAYTFLGLTCTPSESMSVPRNSTDGFENSHFFSFRVWLASCSLEELLLNANCVLPLICYTKGYHPSDKEHHQFLPELARFVFWKCSGAKLLPNSWRWKQNLPNDVMEVVSLADSGDKLICQNPELLSSLLKMVDAASWAKVWSTLGRGWYSLWVLPLSLVRSTQS